MSLRRPNVDGKLRRREGDGETHRERERERERETERDRESAEDVVGVVGEYECDCKRTLKSIVSPHQLLLLLLLT